MTEKAEPQSVIIMTDDWWRRKALIEMTRLTDAAGTLQFEPQLDITAFELAMLLNLVAKLLTNRDLGVPDWRGYLEEHKLTRHFKVV
jgi:hypothetical protein